MTLDSGMAVQQHYSVDEFQQLRHEAAQIRVQAIRSQIAIGLTFCSIAERQLRFGPAEHIDLVIAKLRKLTATVRRHVNEPEHVPSGSVEKLRAELAHLERGMLALEQRALQSFR